MGAILEFQDLMFEHHSDCIRAYFLKYFYFDLPLVELEKIADFKVNGHQITFETSQIKAERQFNRLISIYIKEHLKSLKGSRAVYFHQPPIIGSLRFGLIDRDTNCIEIRPITGCNLNCIYCSVDEGIQSKKIEYLIDKDLLVSEFKKIIEGKKDVEAHIGPQGEPLMYAPLVDLIHELSQIEKVKVISIDTNSILLTKELVDKLADAGLTRINLSINALDADLAKKIAGCNYNIEKIKEISQYIITKMDLLIAPVLLNGINNEEIPKIIEFAKSINAKLGIQNFLEYKGGRNPVKQLTWEVFIKKLEEWEKKFDVKLKLDFKKDFNILEQKTLQKPFRKGQVVDAEIIYDEYAAAQGRLIKIPASERAGKVKIKITRDKHNVFFGSVV
jgi:uncharacterized Fe-S cluster-containing radical SAM superfamily enzyme